MNMIDAYQIIQNVPHLRNMDTREYNLNVMKRNDLYFIFFEDSFIKASEWKRTVAFVTDDPVDISNLMDIYEFANSKGAVEFEFS